MDDREATLGFKPQKEVPYNALLPYVDSLDAESSDQLAHIKANLARVVQLRDIKIGGSHWTGQLTKYIRLYGMKFSKEDHLMLINLLLEMMTIPDLDFSLVQKFAQLLTTLLKKRELIGRNELVLPWRPFYTLVTNSVYSRYEQHGLILLPPNIANVLKSLVRAARVYFPVESTQEMLDEWRPLLCPFDAKMSEGLFYLDLFLPTLIYPHEYDQGFRLWFDELIGIWDICDIHPGWETQLVSLFARVAHDCIGYIDWQPYTPKIFMRLLRSLHVQVGGGNIRVSLSNNCYEPITVAIWIASMLGNGGNTQLYIDRLFKSLESFYHPSNNGRWNTKLLKLLRKIPFHVVKRVHRERYLKTWVPSVPERAQLSDADITQFVNGMTTVASLAIFNKTGSNDSAAAMQCLAMLRPEIIVPPLLDITYPALETLTEPHRLVASLQCTVSVARSMLASARWFPEGRLHVIPLMNLSLPGIDPNDIKKSLMTFQLLSTLASLVPIVDCSEASQHRSDLTEDEVELCSATAQFESFVLQFFDRVFALIDNSVHQHTRGSDAASAENLNPEEAMLDVCLLSTTNSIMQQCSLPIYTEALRRIHKFACESIYEIKVAGRFTSDLVRAAVKVRPDVAVKMFLPQLCQAIIDRASGEDLSKEEHVDNEFLWNLKLLSEIVRCDGRSLLAYKQQLLTVLRLTLHVVCKEVLTLSCMLLKHVLKAVTLTYASDYRSSTSDWDLPLSDVLPIREWGQPGDLHNLGIQWHVPTAEEKSFATELLQEFLVSEFDAVQQHISGAKTLTRDELLQTISIINHCVLGSGAVLPHWDAPAVHLVESAVELRRFSHVATCDPDGITIDGQNVRMLVINCIRPLLDHILSTSEDDTKSLTHIVKVIISVMFFHGAVKNDFDTRWKSRHLVKQFMEHKLLGKKRHIRPLLIDRTQLQHELRTVHSATKCFTTVHQDLFHDLLRLSVSRYMEVRKSAQSALSQGFHVFAYSYRTVLDDVVRLLQADNNDKHHQFKGALYIVLGENKRSWVTKRDWDVVGRVWPALVQAQINCVKPSVLKLFDDVIDKLHNDIETTEIKLVVHEGAVNAASKLWQSSSLPAPAVPSASEDEMKHAVVVEAQRNTANLQGYNRLVEILVNLAEAGNLQWKFHKVALEMLSLLVRHDARLPTSAVELFVNNTVNSTINVRKICILAVTGVLKQQKRKQKKVEFDPYEVTRLVRPTDTNDVRPGDRPDNECLMYERSLLPQNEVDWNTFTFVEKTHWGYYTWPEQMLKYAAVEDQPVQGRTRDQLSDDERPIFDKFTDAQFIETLVKLLTLEENKGKDRFHAKHFTLFKALFKNYDDTVLEVLKSHVERLVNDTAHDTHETSQRCAAEIIAGLIRGSKHWNYASLERMWAWLIPVLKSALVNFTIESLTDWGTCFATASENRDPRKLSPLLELLMDNPVTGDSGSFGDSGRLYILQGALAQQEWRVPELLHRLQSYLMSHLRHPYKNIRDRIGSTLINLFLYNIDLPRGVKSRCPSRADFITQVFPQLEELQTIVLREVAAGISSAVNTDAGISGVNNSADGNPTTAGISGAGKHAGISANGISAAGISAAGISTALGNSSSVKPMAVDAVGESPMSLEGSEVAEDEAELDLDELKLSGSEDDVTLHNGSSSDDEHKKSLIYLSKTLLKWLQGTCSRSFQCISPDVLRLLPLLCLLESETKDLELRRECITTLGYLSQAQLTTQVIPTFINTVNQVSELCSWHARAALLSCLQLAVFCNLFVLQSSDDVVQQLRQLVLRLLSDDQLEVRTLAGVTLSGFLQCGFTSVDKSLISEFERLSKTRLSKRGRATDTSDVDKLKRRHAGIIGLSACVLAFPYQVPDFMPSILMMLSTHLDDPQPIQMTVKKTLTTFKRTHLDSWHDHKQKFTDDQLLVLTELLVSPNYYA